MNNNEVACLYYALLTKLLIEFIRNLAFLKYPANIHNVSLTTFVECMCYHVQMLIF